MCACGTLPAPTPSPCSRRTGSGVTDLAFAPDGRTLASASHEGSIELWDLATATRTGVLEGHTDRVEHVAFMPDGRTLASAAADGTVRLWDAATGAQTAVLEGVITDDRPTVAFSPDGRTLASAGGGAEIVRLWDIALAMRRPRHDDHRGEVHGLAMAPDGRTVAAADHDGTVRLLDAATGVQTGALKVDSVEALGVAFAPDGRTLAGAGRDGTVRLWDLASGTQTAVLDGHELAVNGVAFAPDGRLLASAGDDATLRLWDPATMTQRLVFQAGRRLDDALEAAAFAPDGRAVVSAGYDGAVRLWHVERSTVMAVLDAHVPLVLGIAFAPDGRMLASAGHPGTVQLWKARGRRWGRPAWGLSRRRRRPTAVLKGHVISASSVAFAPDGRTLASGGGYDGTLRLWDVRTQETDLHGARRIAGERARLGRRRTRRRGRVIDVDARRPRLIARCGAARALADRDGRVRHRRSGCGRGARAARPGRAAADGRGREARPRPPLLHALRAARRDRQPGDPAGALDPGLCRALAGVPLPRRRHAGRARRADTRGQAPPRPRARWPRGGAPARGARPRAALHGVRRRPHGAHRVVPDVLDVRPQHGLRLALIGSAPDAEPGHNAAPFGRA